MNYLASHSPIINSSLLSQTIRSYQNGASRNMSLIQAYRSLVSSGFKNNKIIGHGKLSYKCGFQVAKFGQPSIRYLSTETPDYFKLFPQTFDKGLGPPATSYIVDLKKLRKEYRSLQAQNHPDLQKNISELAGSAPDSSAEDMSSFINTAYTTLKDPLKRAQYILKKNANIDVTSDETSQTYQFKDKELLMNILEIHEQLETLATETDLNRLQNENDERIESSELNLTHFFKEEDYESAAIETIKLKYWYNIHNALKEWENGKPVQLTH
ncbi:hypothetical protein BVG19_g2552 [[Candida] boidinii]|nr:hypothetical protein BVG19_g2552 [[Candida] boidinii]OWB49180.1 hypothetical protein B5S27_g720 [[Candida] boidinii]